MWKFNIRGSIPTYLHLQYAIVSENEEPLELVKKWPLELIRQLVLPAGSSFS